MKVESNVTMKAHRNRQMFLWGFVALAAVATLLLILAGLYVAGPARSGPAGKSPEAIIEKIPGKTVPRVILTEKAAQRLGIETGKVSKKLIVRKQMVSGLVIPPMDKQQVAAAQSSPMLSSFGSWGSGKGGGTPAPEPVAPRPISPPSGDIWVLVTLSRGEWEKLAKDKPARLLPLATRDKFQKEILAKPSGMVPVEDVKRSMLSLYYVVSGKDNGLEVNNRIRVELPLSGTEEMQKVVPYSAVYYDAKGNGWVYVNTKPLTFERQRIDVERIEGDFAVLSGGPPVGTKVVTVGAAMLYGVEIFKK